MSQPRVNITNKEDFLKLLLKVETKDVNLKFVFDNIRNYGICALMIHSGVQVLKHKDKEPIFKAYIDSLGAWTLISLSFILFGLNFCHALFAFFAIRDTKELNTYVYLAISLALFFAAGDLMMHYLL